MKLKFLLIVVFAWIGDFSVAQPNLLNYLDLEAAESLKNETISDIVEGPYGFIWIATFGQLYRFDGSELKKELDGDFSDIEINTSAGYMAFTHRRGIYLYHYATNQYINIPDTVFGFHDRTFETSIFDTDSSLLIALQQGIIRYNFQLETYEFIQLQNKQKRNFGVRTIARDLEDEDLFWAGTSAGLFKINLRTRQQEQYIFESPYFRNATSINSITEVYPHADGNIYCGTWYGGVMIFDKSTHKQRQLYVLNKKEDDYRDSHDHIYSIITNKENNLWFSSTVGAMLYDPYKDSVLYHVSSNHQAEGFEIGPRCIDSNGRYWGGYQQGLKLVDHIQAEISQLECPLMDYDDWYIPRKVIQLDNKLYFCTRFSKGLYVYDQTQDSWQFLPSENPRFDAIDFLYAKDTIWMLDVFGFLNYHVVGTDQLHIYPLNYDSIDYRFNSFVRLDGNTFWLLTQRLGIFIVKIKEKTIEPYDEINQKYVKIKTRFGRLLKKDKFGRVWISNSDQLLYGDPEKLAFKDITGLFDTDKILEINTMFETDSFMLLGASRGLFRVNLNAPFADTVRPYVPEFIYDVEALDNSSCWVSTGGTLIHLDFQNNAIRKFTKNDGLVDPGRFGYEAIDCINGDWLIVGGRKKFSIFKPDKLKINEALPKPYVSKVIVNGVELPADSSALQDRVIGLRPKQNTIAFHFSALEFTHPETINFRYRLDGASEGWTIADPDVRNLTYAYLRGGQYIFRLEAQNNLGKWSPAPIIEINIASPVYAQDWFVGSSALFLVGMFAFAYQRRIASIKSKSATQEKLNLLEKQALQAQMNPHFVFNAMNSIQYLISDGQEKAALSYLNKFGKLLRKVLETSSESTILVSDEILLLEHYVELECLRLDGKFTFSIDASPSLINEDIQIPSLILQPFVENAIYHGLAHKSGSGKLKIELLDKEEYVLATIEDDGVGRDESRLINRRMRKNHHSRGIELTKERLRIIQRKKNDECIFFHDIKDAFGNPAGTRVEIKIPLKVK